jgi:hypothetical protein
MTSSNTIPRAPKGSGPDGRKLWRAVLSDYELSEHELSLLTRACRVADACANLQAIVDTEGPLYTTRLGETRTHPALVELRNQGLLLARLITALRVPLGDQEEGAGDGRSQRRGIRGFYLGGAA